MLFYVNIKDSDNSSTLSALTILGYRKMAAYISYFTKIKVQNSVDSLDLLRTFVEVSPLLLKICTQVQRIKPFAFGV